MPTNSVLSPYPSFFDASGEPLENGLIYIGQPGFEARSTPKASFFDQALTIPTGTSTGAAIRTKGGFPINNSNAPTMFYVDGDFSISVCDKNGALLYSALNYTLAYNIGAAAGPVLAADGSLGAVGIGFANEANTGFVRSAANTMQTVVNGVLVAQQTPTGTVFQQPVSGAGFATGVAAALDPDLTQIAAVTRTRGAILRGGAAAWEGLALGAAGRNLVSNGTDLVYSNAMALTLPTRAVNTDYTNTGNRPLLVIVVVSYTAANTDTSLQLGGGVVSRFFIGNTLNGLAFTHTVIVPPGTVYRLNVAAGTASIFAWTEAEL